MEIEADSAEHFMNWKRSGNMFDPIFFVCVGFEG